MLTGDTGRRSSSALVDQAVVSGVNFVTAVFVARVCPIDDYGSFAIAYAIVLLSRSAQSGLITGPMTILSASKEIEVQRRYFSTYAILQLFFGLLVAASIELAVFLIFGGKPGVASTLQASGVAAFFLLWQEYFRRVLFTKYLLSQVLLNDVVVGFTQVGGLLIMWQLMRRNAEPSSLDPSSVVLWMAVAAFIGTLLAFRQCRSLIRPDAVHIKAVVTESWKLSKWLLSVSLLNYAGNQLFVVIVAVMSGMAHAALYEASRLMSGPIQVVQFALGNIVNVEAARRYDPRRPYISRNLVVKVGNVGLILFSGYIILFVLFSGAIIEATVGSKYSDATLPAVLFGLFYLVYWIGSLQETFINAAQKPEINFWGLCLSLGIALSLALALVPRYGSIGGIISLVSSHCAGILYKEWQMRQRIPSAFTMSRGID